MNKQNNTSRSRRQLYVVMIAVLAVVLFVIVISSIVKAPTYQHGGVPKPGKVTLKGKVVCLPHKDTSGPQTLECATGFKDVEGNYYGLKTEKLGSDILMTNNEKEVEISGSYENGGSDIYQMIGTITVDSVKE